MKTSASPTGGWEASVRLDRESPYLVVDAVVDGTSFRLVVDTGSEAFLLFERAVPRAWARRMSLETRGSDLAGRSSCV